MDYKAIPFSHLIYNAKDLTVTRDDFASVIHQDFFLFDESGEAAALLSDEEKAAVAEFDSRFSS